MAFFFLLGQFMGPRAPLGRSLALIGIFSERFLVLPLRQKFVVLPAAIRMIATLLPQPLVPDLNIFLSIGFIFFAQTRLTINLFGHGFSRLLLIKRFPFQIERRPILILTGHIFFQNFGHKIFANTLRILSLISQSIITFTQPNPTTPSSSPFRL
jgi:hypothetical protein